MTISRSDQVLCREYSFLGPRQGFDKGINKFTCAGSYECMQTDSINCVPSSL